MHIMSDEIELVGNILQDICSFFHITDIDTSYNYNDLIKELSNLITRIENLDSQRNQFSINMSEIMTFIKDLFVRAEDNRLLDDMYIIFGLMFLDWLLRNISLRLI